MAILSDALDENTDVAAVGTSIVLPDGSPGASAFRFPSLASEILETLNIGPLNQTFAHRMVRLPADHPRGHVDWVSGTAVMFRFQALKDAGFFDPDFFLYFEETELQHRLGRAGWRAMSVPEAQVSHAEGAATGQSGLPEARRIQPDYLYRSKWLYFLKTKGRAWALAVALLIVPAATMNVMQRRLRGRPPTIPLRFFADHWRHGIKPLLMGQGVR